MWRQSTELKPQTALVKHGAMYMRKEQCFQQPQKDSFFSNEMNDNGFENKSTNLVDIIESIDSKLSIERDLFE